MAGFHLSSLSGLPEIHPGDDLALHIANALAAGQPRKELRDGEIVVIAQKVVSKAEGALRSLSAVQPGSAPGSSPPRETRTRASYRSCSMSPRRFCGQSVG